MLPGYPAGMAATSPPYPTPRGAIPWGHPARNLPAGEGWGEGGLGTTNRLVRRVELTGATSLPTLSRKWRGRNNQRLAMTLRLIQRCWPQAADEIHGRRGIPVRCSGGHHDPRGATDLLPDPARPGRRPLRARAADRGARELAACRCGAR